MLKEILNRKLEIITVSAAGAAVVVGLKLNSLESDDYNEAVRLCTANLNAPQITRAITRDEINEVRNKFGIVITPNTEIKREPAIREQCGRLMRGERSEQDAYHVITAIKGTDR